MRKSVGRWPMFDRVLRRARRMDDMMERMGADPALAARQDHGSAYARARTVCLVCPFTEHCERWLAQASVEPAPPRVCPNAAFFAASLRRRVPVQHDE
ncbi:MAG TPA: DUF6455 family protein [Hyphomicrobiaceae bacterium]|nr:DUF6455 family protein [Hyphomicrobiaceae bacterium]